MHIGRQFWIGSIFGLSLLGVSGAAHGAVISNFSGVFDTTTDRLQFSFDIDPVDADTPLGVDSITFDFDGLPLDGLDRAFINGVSTLLFSSVPGATGEFLHDDKFNIDFPVINALTSLTFIIDNVVTTGLATDPSYDIDFIMNTVSGTTPSALGQQIISDIATQADFTQGSLAIPAPGTVALFGLGLAGLGLARRRRDAA